MSLNWDLTKCKDLDSIETDKEWVITEALIWLTMGTGIGDVSQKNAAEFYARIHLLEAIDGAWLGFRGEDGERVDRPITPKDVEKRIGMSTNVFPMETRNKWLNRIGKRVLDQSSNQYVLGVKAENDE